MSRALPILAVCLSILALALALVPRDVPMPAAPSVPSEPVGAARASELLVLQQRVEELERQNRGLWERVGALERGQPAMAAVTPTPEPVAAAPSPEAIKDLVNQAVVERDAERKEARGRALDAHARAQEEAWQKFVTDARLTPQQQELLEKRLRIERELQRGLRQSGDELAPAEARDAMRELRNQRRETDKTMSTVLDATQREQYDVVRRGDSFRFGGRR